MSESPRDRLHAMAQVSHITSPWSRWVRIKGLLWSIVYVLLYRPTPKPLRRWRLFLLRLFGCKITGLPYVAPSAWVKMPWNLTLGDHACLGPQSEVYNLGPVILEDRACVSQQAYLCAGTHDFSKPNLPLVVGPIVLGKDCFLGARAFIMPGVIVGEGAVIGACAVVTADMPPWTICAGHPCKPIKPRSFAGQSAPTAAQ